VTDTEPIIDVHVHHYTDDYLTTLEAAAGVETYRRPADGRFVARWNGGVALTVPQPHPTLEQRLDMMDQVGIRTQVLSVPSPNSYFLPAKASADLALRTNEAFAEIVRARPARFQFLAMVPLVDVDFATEVTEVALGQLGAKGIMLLTNVDGVPLDDARFEPYWQYADERGLLVHMHPTVPVAGGTLADHALAISVGFFADTNLAVARMAYSGIFERYPRIQL
jgi:aminocarboxymuconate-semialdehyde decarboxylase